MNLSDLAKKLGVGTLRFADEAAMLEKLKVWLLLNVHLLLRG